MTASRSRSRQLAKGVEGAQLIISLHCGEPARKVLALALGEHDGEGADVLDERGQLRASGQDRLELELVVQMADHDRMDRRPRSKQSQRLKSRMAPAG